MKNNRGNTTVLELKDGSRVGVIGAGPAGSLFSYFLLDLAAKLKLKITLDIYESRDFLTPGPAGCNMCAGVISETMVQNLSLEGINLPPTVVQRGIDSYVIHSESETMTIKTPLDEKRIATVYRGSGSRGLTETKWKSFDDYLLELATNKGANLIHGRVVSLERHEGKLRAGSDNREDRIYELVVVAVGVNSPGLTIFERLLREYKRPKTRKAFIAELPFGHEVISRGLGSAMHIFLLKIPGIDFAAFVPKGDFVTVCLIGEGIDSRRRNSFFSHPAVKGIIPGENNSISATCHCSPQASLGNAVQPFGDRIVLIGDCGVARLNKDGIGSAYRTAKIAATTALFEGVSSGDFQRYYWPVCRSISNDNRYGRIIYAIVNIMKQMQFLVRGALYMAQSEQKKAGDKRTMSSVFWDMFTGSAPYRDVFMRTLHPMFMLGFIWYTIFGILTRKGNIN